jgi:hypothetical protein
LKFYFKNLKGVWANIDRFLKCDDILQLFFTGDPVLLHKANDDKKTLIFFICSHVTADRYSTGTVCTTGIGCY